LTRSPPTWRFKNSREDTQTRDRAIFLDFDHTLFNTDEFFHVDVRTSFRHLGLDSASWEQGYARAWRAGYSLEGHAEEMYRQTGGHRALEEMKRILRESFTDLRRYLFSDVLPFLGGAKERGVHLYLLSFGDPDWQRYKVRGSGIEPYFDGIFITAQEGGKANIILEQAGSCQKAVIVDNNPSELDLIKEAAPDIATYCINRVPRELVVPADEISRLRYLEARDHATRPWRYQHVPCRTLEEVGTS
jgi:FMN phosphatase YigB (HAD superfamily)